MEKEIIIAVIHIIAIILFFWMTIDLMIRSINLSRWILAIAWIIAIMQTGWLTIHRLLIVDDMAFMEVLSQSKQILASLGVLIPMCVVYYFADKEMKKHKDQVGSGVITGRP